MLRSVLILGLALWPAVSFAGGVGYARATSQLLQDTKPALHNPLNLLDGKDGTVWCEGVDGDGVGEGVLVGFRGTATIDEVRITTGDTRDPSTFKAHNRVTQLELKTADGKHSFVLVDSKDPQPYKLDKPIEADQVLLEIAAVARGEGADNATCIADVVFLYRGKPLNGAFLADKLRYDRGRAKVMGTWYAGPDGARDRFLDFYFDGTFHYRYKPFDPEVKAVSITGDYTYDGAHLRLKVPKGWIDEKTAPKPGENGLVLELAAKALKDTLAGTWSEKP